MKINYILNGVANLLFLFSSVVISAQCSGTTVPYFEGFQNITSTNQLPTCWAASNASVTCLTFTTPSKYAAFYYSPGGANYFYSEGIQLAAGVSYSAALFYKTDNSGSLNWTDLSILFGTSQSPAGLTSIASTSGPASSPSYTLLSNVFTVPISGIYYIVVRGTGTNTSSSQYLNWDNLSVTIPCVPNSINTPTMGSTQRTATICEGQDTITFNAPSSGPNTYLWTTGATTPSAAVSPPISTMYSVAITNSISGCVSTFTYYLSVNPVPPFLTTANPSNVCPGDSSTLLVTSSFGLFGSVLWSTGATGSVAVVHPTATTVYSVTRTTTAGCTTSASVAVIFHPMPTIIATASNAVICKTETTVLIGSGGVVYIWMPTGFGSKITVSPSANTTYTVIGTDIFGCTNTATVEVQVVSCTGISSMGETTGDVKIHPNPTYGVSVLQVPRGKISCLKVLDTGGKILLAKSINSEEVKVDMQEFSPGLYFFVIETGDHFEVRKVLKE